MPALKRRNAIQILLRDRRDLVVVSGLGSSTYDVASVGDHERNLYLWGAMGNAAMVAVGLAVARPDVDVLCVTGDGEMLMGLGALATIGVRGPRNLAIAILDNSRYGETGMQESHTATTCDLTGVAKACGISCASTIRTEQDLVTFKERVHKRLGPAFARIVIDTEEVPRVLPTRNGVEIKLRVQSALSRQGQTR